MADPNLDEINTAVTKKIMPGVVDDFFKGGPIMAYMKENRMKPFPGGSKIQENFLYRPMVTDAFPPGGQFNVTRSQTKAGLLFDLKYYYSNCTIFPEITEVLLRTPEAAFSTVKTDLANCALSLSSKLEIDIVKHGQNLGGANDRSLRLNGLDEALNNGVNVGWEGFAFASYGEQSRADVNGALYPAGGNPAVTPVVNANVNGAITSRVLEQSYQTCVIGPEAPKLGITTNRCMGFINENYMPLQRLVDTKDPVIGWTGIKFKDATIVQSQYLPGADGVNDPDLGDYSNSTELFIWLNPGGEGDDAYMRLHMSSSPRYQFGFTGFKPAQDSTQLAGQILVALNFSVRSVRLNRLLFGINA